GTDLPSLIRSCANARRAGRTSGTRSTPPTTPRLEMPRIDHPPFQRAVTLTAVARGINVPRRRTALQPRPAHRVAREHAPLGVCVGGTSNPRARPAPSPRRGEGWGEGVTAYR